MKKLIFLLIFGFSTAFAADVPVKWDPVLEATGYKVYQSINPCDAIPTWIEVANVTDVTVIIPDVPDSGMVLFRVSAYNSNGESIRYWSGAWYRGDWKPLESPGGTGIQ